MKWLHSENHCEYSVLACWFVFFCSLQVHMQLQKRAWAHVSLPAGFFLLLLSFAQPTEFPKRFIITRHWSDPSISHRRHGCILSLSLCKHTWHFLRAPVNMFNNTSSGTHLTTHADIIGIGHASAPVTHCIVEQTGFKAAWDASQSGKHTLSSSFVFLVFRLLWWLFGRRLMWTALLDCADKCSRLQIKKLSFSFLFSVSVQSKKNKANKNWSKGKGDEKVIHPFSKSIYCCVWNCFIV